VLDAALTLFAERGHHGRHPVYAPAWAGPTCPHGGVLIRLSSNSDARENPQSRPADSHLA
jgi:hypothetical protein